MLTERGLNALFDDPILGFSFLWLPLFVFIVALKVMWHKHIAVKIISPFLLAFSVFCFCFGNMWGWTWRDGLGPGMEVTEGPAAVARFMEGFWPLFTFCSSIFVFALVPCLIDTIVRNRQKR